MVADLAGSVIRSVELSMLNLDAGVDVVTVTFGVHASATAPAGYLATRRNVWADDWPRVGSGEGWRLPSGAQLIRVAEWIRDGVVRGLTVEQPASVGSGVLDWTSIRLRINYTK